MFSRSRIVMLALAVSLTACACEERAGTAPREPSNIQSTHSKGVARVLIDLSNSFAPFDDVKAGQIEMLFGALAKHIQRNWSLRGTFSVHAIDSSTVTAPPLCPPIEYSSGGLLHKATIDITKLSSVCARLVKARSQTPAKTSDIRNAINIAASSFATDTQTRHLIVVVSDFVDTDASTVVLDPLRGISVLMIYAPEKTATNSNDYLRRISNWQETFAKQGVQDIRKIQLLTATETDVLTQLPDRSQ